MRLGYHYSLGKAYKIIANSFLTLFRIRHSDVNLTEQWIIQSQNKHPASCRESLCSPTLPCFVFHKVLDARIKNLSTSLFEGKLTDHGIIVGENKVLPHLLWRRFEGFNCFLHIASKIEGENAS